MKFSTFLTGIGLTAGIASAGTTRHARAHAHRKAHDQAVEARQVVVNTFLCHNEQGQHIVCPPGTVPEGYVEVKPGSETTFNPNAGLGRVDAAQPGPEQAKKEDENKPAPNPQIVQNAAPLALSGAGGPRGGAGHGVTYSPYGGGRCRTVDDFRKDWASFAGKYSTIRLYGTDCEQVKFGITVAKEIGLQVMLGIFDVPNAVEQANVLIKQVGNDWAYVHSVNVGNEAVMSHGQSPDAVVGAIGAVRGLVQAAGFRGPVLTVESFHIVLQYPQLCEASDYCGVNMHPYFNAQVSAAAAGKFMSDSIADLKAKVPNKDIYITETGWPWAGGSRTSKEEQAIALDGIKAAFKNSRDRLFLFSAYNEPWKGGGVEPFWGMDGDRPSGA